MAMGVQRAGEQRLRSHLWCHPVRLASAICLGSKPNPQSYKMHIHPSSVWISRHLRENVAAHSPRCVCYVLFVWEYQK